MVSIADGTGTTAAAPADQLRVFIRTADGERPIAGLPGWELERSAGPWDGPGTRVRLHARWRGAEPIRAGLVVRRSLAGPTRPHILIPAVFYSRATRSRVPSAGASAPASRTGSARCAA